MDATLVGAWLCSGAASSRAYVGIGIAKLHLVNRAVQAAATANPQHCQGAPLNVHGHDIPRGCGNFWVDRADRCSKDAGSLCAAANIDEPLRPCAQSWLFLSAANTAHDTLIR